MSALTYFCRNGTEPSISNRQIVHWNNIATMPPTSVNTSAFSHRRRGGGDDDRGGTDVAEQIVSSPLRIGFPPGQVTHDQREPHPMPIAPPGESGCLELSIPPASTATSFWSWWFRLPQFEICLVYGGWKFAGVLSVLCNTEFRGQPISTSSEMVGESSAAVSGDEESRLDTGDGPGIRYRSRIIHLPQVLIQVVVEVQLLSSVVARLIHSSDGFM